MMRRASTLISLVVLVGLLTSCSRTEVVVPTPEPPLVKVITADKGAMVNKLSYPGNVQSTAQVALTPEVAGRIKSITVDIGSEVKAGQLVASLDTASYELQHAQAQAALAVAQAQVAAIREGARPEQVSLALANLYAAQERLAGMQAGGRSELVLQAQENVNAAQAQLDQALRGPTPEQIEQAEAALRLARNNEYYQQQQADADGKAMQQIPGDPVNREELKRSALGVAYEQTKIAEAKLAEVKAGATPEQIAQLQAAVEAAKHQLNLAENPYTEHDLGQAAAAVMAAEQQVALAQSPFTQGQLDAAQAGVEQARAAVDLAALQVQKTSIASPLDGVVSQKLMAEGAMAAPTTPLMMIVSRNVEITVNVEEARIAALRVGQPANITVSAYPGVNFPAQVSAISPSVDPRNRTVAVKIRPEQDNRLLDGMFAQVSIIASEERQVLQVPLSAISERNGQKTVFVVTGDTVIARAVTTGLADGARVEIIEGLAEGEQVVSQGTDVLIDGQKVRT